MHRPARAVEEPLSIPAVIAMQDQVPMALSTDLTRRFFQSLLVHGLIDRSLAEARWLLAESGSADWSIRLPTTTG